MKVWALAACILLSLLPYSTAAAQNQAVSPETIPVGVAISQATGDALPLETTVVVAGRKGKKASKLEDVVADPTATSIILQSAGMGVGVQLASGLGGGLIGEGIAITAVLVAQGFHKGGVVTYSWSLQNPNSAYIYHNTEPPFEVEYRNFPGIDPKEYMPVVLRMKPLQPVSNPPNGRLICASLGRTSSFLADRENWKIYSSLMEEPVIVKAEIMQPGLVRLSRISDFPKGEYGIVLRPANQQRKVAGIELLDRGEGDGAVFSSVWTFSVR